jgi:hypothetical protein
MSIKMNIIPFKSERNKPIILCDVDGVVLDFLSKLPEFLAKKCFDNTTAIQAYAYGEFMSLAEITGLPEAQARALIEDYNSSEYIKYLNPYKDAIAVVNLLKNDYDFIAVTAIGKSQKCADNRMHNLNFWYPDAFTGIHVVDIGENKKDILEAYTPTIFVDDSPNYCKEGIEAGHYTIRLVRDRRPDTVATMHANDWFDVATLINQYNTFKSH